MDKLTIKILTFETIDGVRCPSGVVLQCVLVNSIEPFQATVDNIGGVVVLLFRRASFGQTPGHELGDTWWSSEVSGETDRHSLQVMFIYTRRDQVFGGSFSDWMHCDTPVGCAADFGGNHSNWMHCRDLIGVYIRQRRDHDQSRLVLLSPA